MAAYYNEIDKYAAQWLRNLIAEGVIAPGDVDERDIRDVRPADLAGYAQCHFFAGIGVWSYALRRAGWPDDRPVWTGSCPCQPFSAAGRGAGFADERHLWPAWFHLIRVRRPDVVFGEQVASKDGLLWLDLVLDDLQGEGYAVGPADSCSAGIGAPHIRQRASFVAHTNDAQRRSEGARRYKRDRSSARWDQSHRDAWERLHGPDWLRAAAEFFENAHGAPARMGRLRAYGNAINAEDFAGRISDYFDAEAAGFADCVGPGSLEDLVG